MMMQHGAYAAEIEFEEEENSFHGRVINLARDGFDFWGRDVDELRAEFALSVTVYEEVCRERGEEPEQPHGGPIVVSGTPELYRALRLAAAREHKSIDAWAAEALSRAAGV